jgi:hypothetical protein
VLKGRRTRMSRGPTMLLNEPMIAKRAGDTVTSCHRALSSCHYPRPQYMLLKVLHFLKLGHVHTLYYIACGIKSNVPWCVFFLVRFAWSNHNHCCFGTLLAPGHPQRVFTLNDHLFPSPIHRPEHSRWHVRRPVLCSSPTGGRCPTRPAHNNVKFDPPSASLHHVLLYDRAVDMGPIASC